jgi:hypothetical protein
MMIRWKRFNIYLASLVAALLPACETTGGKTAGKKGKEASTFRIYLETRRPIPEHTREVTVYRDHPEKVLIFTDPAIDERHLEKVEVIDVAGSKAGFVMVVRLSPEGRLLAQNISSSERGKRIVIESMFTELRYLGAPYLSKYIPDGILVFEPDATREESERIVRGINNLIKAINK